MQAVILAAGRGTRMGELTSAVPKPMLTVHGRPVLEHIIDALPVECDEVILIVGYLQEKIREHFGTEYKGRKIFYREQTVLDGTGGALWCVKDLLHDKFLVMNGDDICSAEDMRACAESADWAVLALHVDDVGSGGLVVVDERMCVTDILEKEAHTGGPGYVNPANFFLLDMRIFSYDPVYRPGSTTEFGLPQTVVQARHDIPIHVVEAHIIVRLTEPEDIQKAEAIIAAQ